MIVEDVDFWDHEGVGIFSSIYWTRDESDFPSLWKSKGFDWNLSYEEWIEVFEKMGFIITVTRQPNQHNALNAEFEALSSDKILNFILFFDYGEDGYYTSSPNTLYSITVDFKGDTAEKTIATEEHEVDIKNNKNVEIEHVYVGIPSAEPYSEVEYEDEPQEVEVKKPSVLIDPMKLDKIFEKKATSYKYFWFMAIISLVKEKNVLTLPYKDIVIRMAAMAWPIVFEYKMDLGRGDMIPKYLNDILEKTTLTEQYPSKVVEAYMNVYYESEGIGEILEALLKNLPYLFLSPWIQYTTDEEVIEKSNSSDYACLYALHDDYLILNEEWWDYIKTRYKSICNSVERSFITYVKQKNKHNKMTRFMAAGWSLV
jgi:hypothetical protein